MVEQFINHFHRTSKTGDVTEVFTNGCCYWFAFILCSRFEGARIMYDQVANHFAAEIGGRLYDITGDVTGQYNMIPWDKYDDIVQDDLEKSRILDYCVNFTKS